MRALRTPRLILSALCFATSAVLAGDNPAAGIEVLAELIAVTVAQLRLCNCRQFKNAQQAVRKAAATTPPPPRRQARQRQSEGLPQPLTLP